MNLIYPKYIWKKTKGGIILTNQNQNYYNARRETKQLEELSMKGSN